MNDPIPLVLTARDRIPLALDHLPAKGIVERPVLLVHGFAQNRYTFHHPRRSLAVHLASAGHPVYMLEHRGHGRSKNLSDTWARSIDDYLRLDLPAALDFVLGREGTDRLHLLGHSLGGLLSLVYAGDNPDQVLSVTTLASPSPRFGMAPLFQAPSMRASGALSRLAHKHNRTMRSFPINRLGAFAVRLDQLLKHRLPLSGIRPWLPGSFEPDLEYDRMTIGFDPISVGVARDFMDWAASGRGAADLSAGLDRLRTPALLLHSPQDETVPPAYHLTRADLPATAPVTETSIPGFGHCDIVLGKTAPDQVWPQVVDWLETHTS